MTRMLGPVIRGAGASAVGTLAMDTLLYRRYRNGGGDAPFAGWESSDGLATWEDAPAPALVAKQLLETMLETEVSPRYARFLNNATHWGYGLTTGGAYGFLVGPRAKRRLSFGPPFGAAVWASGYVVFPLLGVYEPIWKYDLKTLAKDLSAHLVFGTVTAAAFSLLEARKES
jgi:hypothetical protein